MYNTSLIHAYVNVCVLIYGLISSYNLFYEIFSLITIITHYFCIYNSQVYPLFVFIQYIQCVYLEMCFYSGVNIDVDTKLT